MTARKSEPWRIVMRLSTPNGLALAAALEPEPVLMNTLDDGLEFVLYQDRVVDLRARWNGAVRALVAAEEALMTGAHNGISE